MSDRPGQAATRRDASTDAGDGAGAGLTAYPAFPGATPVLAGRGPARMARFTAGAICAMAAGAIVYAAVATMDVVVSVQGKVVPSGKSKVVQAMEAGAVRAIHVRDGQRVRAGEALVELDPTAAGADRERLARDCMEAGAAVRRLTAMLDGKRSLPPAAGVPDDVARVEQALFDSVMAAQAAKLAALDAEAGRRRAEQAGAAAGLAQIRASVALAARKHDMRAALAHRGYLAEVALIEARQELAALRREQALQAGRLAEAGAGLRAARQQRAQAIAEFTARHAAELSEQRRKATVARLELRKAEQRHALQTLRAPIDGVVQQLAVTTVGGVVTPAQPVATVVPADAALEVEALVGNRDVGYVTPGQRAVTKVETFDFTRFGYIESAVEWVGADAINDAKLGQVYPLRIRLTSTTTPHAVNGRAGALAPGMRVTADIRVDERRMLSYFLSPLLRYRDEALRER